jgi:lipid-A-disaccharide synthase
VRGYAEVISALPRLLLLRHRLKRRVIAERPDLFLGIDAPDFNLGLEKQLKRAGVKTAHFISPSVWSWRKERLNYIAQSVDHMLLVFPMEKKIYAEAGIPATYVGHPMADEIALLPDQGAARARLGLAVEASMIAVLPGSRLSEIHQLLPPFLEALRVVHQTRPETVFVIPAATAIIKSTIEAMVAAAKLPEQLDLRILLGRARDCMEAANTILVASGTACLEAALLKKPMVIAYKVTALTWMRMRDMSYLPYVGLPNILCGGWIVPEFIQEKVDPKAMATALLKQLDSDSFGREVAERFTTLHHELRQNCGQRAAAKLIDLMAVKD